MPPVPGRDHWRWALCSVGRRPGRLSARRSPVIPARTESGIMAGCRRPTPGKCFPIFRSPSRTTSFPPTLVPWSSAPCSTVNCRQGMSPTTRTTCGSLATASITPTSPVLASWGTSIMSSIQLVSRVSCLAPFRSCRLSERPGQTVGSRGAPIRRRRGDSPTTSIPGPHEHGREVLFPLGRRACLRTVRMAAVGFRMQSGSAGSRRTPVAIRAVMTEAALRSGAACVEPLLQGPHTSRGGPFSHSPAAWDRRRLRRTGQAPPQGPEDARGAKLQAAYLLQGQGVDDLEPRAVSQRQSSEQRGLPKERTCES